MNKPNPTPRPTPPPPQPDITIIKKGRPMSNQACCADYYPLMKTLTRWINRLHYRFTIWKSDRALIRQKKAIGRALLPTMKELLNEIESRKDG